jgi:nucleoside-diphosphate-sugar epimerase
MRHVLVTGSTGYLGGELKKYLELRNYDVWIGIHDSKKGKNPSTQKSVTLSAIGDGMDTLEFNFTDLVLCGTPTLPTGEADLLEYFDDAVLNQYAWIRKLAKQGLKRIVFIGSYWQEPEGTGFLQTNIYSLAKQSLQYMLSALNYLNINVDIVHLGDLYGPGDHRAKLIPEVIRKIERQEKVVIEYPNYFMRPIYLSDVLCGIESLLLEEYRESADTVVHSMLGPAKFTVEEVVLDIFKVFNADKKLIVSSHNMSVSPYSGDSQYLFPISNYEFISLESGINLIKNDLKS